MLVFLVFNTVLACSKVPNPIYDFLHASPDEIPILNLAGPLTGFDSTYNWSNE
jgi:hypothetical protein